MLRLLATIVAMAPAVVPANHANADTWLVLTVADGKTAVRSATLRCDPPGGTAPKAAQACADLSRAGGEIGLRSRDQNPQACFMIYSPVTASAYGAWQGRRVRFTRRYPNACVLRSQTGSVFDF